MRSSLLLVTSVLPFALGFPHFTHLDIDSSVKVPRHKREPGCNSTLVPKHFTWAPPGPGDVRSPCPTLNTLSNHGFLPHSGRNVTVDVVISGFKDGMGIGEDIAVSSFTRALGANPVPNSTFIDLDMLHIHNFIEHDGSLSRVDALVDPSNAFNATIFDNFLSFFGEDPAMNISATANARARHAIDMRTINPNSTITEDLMIPIFGENAMMLAVWGDPLNPIANRSFYEFFFRNERLPVEIGWSPSTTEIGPTIGQIMDDLTAQSPADVPLTFGPV